MAAVSTAVQWQRFEPLATTFGDGPLHAAGNEHGSIRASAMTDETVARIQSALDAMSEIFKSTFGGKPPREDVAPPETVHADGGALTDW